MTDFWLPAAHRHDLSLDSNGEILNGGGPFAPGTFMGLVVHVNVSETGTPDSFYGVGNNPSGVCPTFQLQKDDTAPTGGLRQYLPANWQPAAQVAGNARWAAVETAGLPNEPFTPFQLSVLAGLCVWYHDHMGMVLQVTDHPTIPGLGTHGMGGVAWGDHPFCPGSIRAAQRAAIVAAARSVIVARGPHQRKGDKMLLIQNSETKVGALIIDGDNGVLVTNPGDYTALQAGGVPAAQITPALMNAIQKRVGGFW